MRPSNDLNKLSNMNDTADAIREFSVNTPGRGRPSINQDAQFLRDKLARGDFNLFSDSDLLRLHQIADNIESLDEANAQAYQLGLRDGEERVYARSNLPRETIETLADKKARGLKAKNAAIIQEALANGKVTKVPKGMTASQIAEAKARPAKVPGLIINLEELGLI